MFGQDGNVACARCCIPTAGDADDKSVQAALRNGGLDAAIVGAESMLVCFTGHPAGVKGRSISSVMNGLRRHVKPDALIGVGLQYDSTMPQEALQFDVWASAPAS